MDIQEAIFLNRKAYLVDSFGDTNGMLIEANHKAIEALEKWQKYAWHDLRKNPDDLPCFLKNVLIVSTNFYEPIVAYRTRDKGFVAYGVPIESVTSYEWTNLDVIAWREIEPFECEVE